MTRGAMMVSMMMSIIVLLTLLLNSRLAWSTPNNVPKWIEKRIKPVKDDQYAFAMEAAQFALFFSGVGLIYNYLF